VSCAPLTPNNSSNNITNNTHKIIQTSALAALLKQRHSQLKPPTLDGIAAKAIVNVHAALEDAASEMDVFRFQQMQLQAA
jgi:hypothetical protein